MLVPKNITLKGLSKIFHDTGSTIAKMLEADPTFVRSITIQMKMLALHPKVFDKKSTLFKLLLTVFFTKKEKPFNSQCFQCFKL
jgi:hypothetical protein